MRSTRRYSTMREFRKVAIFEWSVRHVWDSWRAATRGTWWWLIRRYPTELCTCGRPVSKWIGETWWHAEDDLWLAVKGNMGGTLCPRCFTLRAAAKGISLRWQPVREERDG